MSQHMDRDPVGASGPPNIQDMELREEWQDDGFPRFLNVSRLISLPAPAGKGTWLQAQMADCDQDSPPSTISSAARPLPEDCGSLEAQSPSEAEQQPDPPTSLALSGTVSGGAKKRLVAPCLSLTLSRGESHDLSHDDFSAAALSPTPDETPSLDINLEALETPSDSETGTLPDSTNELEWEDDLPRTGRGEAAGLARSPVDHSEGLMELDQVDDKGRRWRRFCIAGQEYQVNMSVLEPYLQVLSHGGYYGDGMNAIILFTSCYLPENTVEDYDYVMDNLFRYIVGTLDLMVSENYLLVYLCAMAPRNKMPAVKWLHQCYTSIDRRLKKDLKGLLVVHPAWYIKAVLTLVRPFISDKFSRKIRFIHSLQQLSEFIPTDRLQIPDAIRQFDEKLNR